MAILLVILIMIGVFMAFPIEINVQGKKYVPRNHPTPEDKEILKKEMKQIIDNFNGSPPPELYTLMSSVASKYNLHYFVRVHFELLNEVCPDKAQYQWVENKKSEPEDVITFGERGQDGFVDVYLNGVNTGRTFLFTQEQIERIEQIKKELNV